MFQLKEIKIKIGQIDIVPDQLQNFIGQMLIRDVVCLDDVVNSGFCAYIPVKIYFALNEKKIIDRAFYAQMQPIGEFNISEYILNPVDWDDKILELKNESHD